MTFSVTILGSSSALPTANRFPSAHVINSHERLFLVDCAEGTQIQLRRYHQKMNRINHIFLSHLHGDHVLGIFGLISTFNLLGRTTPLNIYAHPDFEEI
ncbi:MAG TPA: MBL fold metallo-hydrolase, partial [Tenuifilaceae bacterium]|nr:MBL fold metallo-hydrolase [Tenuifilaceae bacterium]